MNCALKCFENRTCLSVSVPKEDDMAQCSLFFPQTKNRMERDVLMCIKQSTMKPKSDVGYKFISSFWKLQWIRANLVNTTSLPDPTSAEKVSDDIDHSVQKVKTCRVKRGSIPVHPGLIFIVQRKTGDNSDIIAYDTTNANSAVLFTMTAIVSHLTISGDDCTLYLSFPGERIDIRRFSASSVGYVGDGARFQCFYIDVERNFMFHLFFHSSQYQICMLKNMSSPASDCLISVFTDGCVKGCFGGHRESQSMVYCTMMAAWKKVKKYNVYFANYKNVSDIRPRKLFDIQSTSIAVSFLTSDRLAILLGNNTLVYYDIQRDVLTTIFGCPKVYQSSHLASFNEKALLHCYSEIDQLVLLFDGKHHKELAIPSKNRTNMQIFTLS